MPFPRPSQGIFEDKMDKVLGWLKLIRETIGSIIIPISSEFTLTWNIF